MLSCDYAIPHLLDDADVTRALRAMYSKLLPAASLIGIRDYDTALIGRAGNTKGLVGMKSMTFKVPPGGTVTSSMTVSNAAVGGGDSAYIRFTVADVQMDSQPW